MAKRELEPTTGPGGLPWYAEGLRFQCQPDCGACCTRHDDYGYVYLEPGDVSALAAHLAVGLTAFRRRWTRREDGYTILVMGDDACPFLEGSRCTVYEARPTQCRTFPFWKENVATRERWTSLATFCPGIGQGDRVPLKTIRALARRRSVEGA